MTSVERSLASSRTNDPTISALPTAISGVATTSITGSTPTLSLLSKIQHLDTENIHDYDSGVQNADEMGFDMPDYVSLISNQVIHTVPYFQLESGAVLEQVPVAYKTWGKLNATRDNVMVICHAFTGSADVEDWWGPLMGINKAFDPSRYFIFCANVMGSPYGSASPVTINPSTGFPYGPEFPATTIRDDVRLHKLVLDHLNVRSVSVVVGGSMGGMAVLEWPLCTPPNYIKHIIPLATSARHSAWCISWSEAQRQSIYSDPLYAEGYYYLKGSLGTPKSGLAAARMAALLTYRSRDSFESRFGRKPQVLNKTVRSVPGGGGSVGGAARAGGNPLANRSASTLLTPPRSPSDSPSLKALDAHNEGNRNRSFSSQNSQSRQNITPPSSSISATTASTITTSPISEPPVLSLPTRPAQTPSTSTSTPTVFSAQGYLRYQGDKFTSRFDANCYIHITRKMDTHDVARDRSASSLNSSQVSATDESYSLSPSINVTLPDVLAALPRGSLIIGVESDGLFTPNEQRELAEYIPDAELVIIKSKDGHDGFLLEFEEINRHVLDFLRRVLPGLYEGQGAVLDAEQNVSDNFEVKKTSTFGEAEVDVALW